MPSILSDKIAQVKALKSGMGLQCLLDEVHKIMGNPILLHSLEYQLITHSGNVVTDDPIWNEILRDGEYSEKTIHFFKTESFIDDIADAQNLALLHSDALQHDRLSGKIRSKDGITVAHLVIIASQRPFHAYDPALFEAACNAVSKEISTIAYYQEYSDSYQDTMIAKLIDGEIEDRALFAGHVANMYGDSSGNLFVGVVDIAEEKPERCRLVHFRSLLKQAEPTFKYAVYSNYIVMIMTSEREALSKKKDLHRLNRLFKQKNIYAGVSDCFDNIYELAKYYDRAVGALEMGRGDSGGQKIFFYSKRRQSR